MATFDSKEEAQYFHGLVTEDTWVGIKKVDGKWKTITDGKDVTNIIPWHEGEPNQSAPCVKTWSDGGYDDYHCTEKLQIGCESVDYFN